MKNRCFFPLCQAAFKKRFCFLQLPKGTGLKLQMSCLFFKNERLRYELTMHKRDGTDRLHVKPIFVFVNLDFHLCILFSCCRNDLSPLSQNECRDYHSEAGNRILSPGRVIAPQKTLKITDNEAQFTNSFG